MNIRFVKSTHWVGQTGENKGFCVFSSDMYGLRAGMMIIQRYIKVYKLNTIDLILSRFAPASENNLSAYKSFCYAVFKEYQLDPNRTIKLNSYAFYVLIRSLCIFESNMYYTPEYLSSLSFSLLNID